MRTPDPSVSESRPGRAGNNAPWMLCCAHVATILTVLAAGASAQATDLTQTPNTAQAGIAKSWIEQIGAGRGNTLTPESSAYLIARDPFRAIVRGRQVFQRKFRQAQGLGPRTGDGIGDIETDGSLGAGLADSCAACHGRPQGAAGFGGAVFTRPTSRDAPHLFGIGLVEMLADEMTRDLRSLRSESILRAISLERPYSAQLVSKGIDFGLLVAFPDGTLDTSGVKGVDSDLRVRPFFAQGGTTSIREFLVGAFNAEMGLEAADTDLLAASQGADIVTPSGMALTGSMDAVEGPPAITGKDDPDSDGIVDEVPIGIVDMMEFYLLNYFRPATSFLSQESPRGLQLMTDIGCTSCHVANLWIEADRRVADVRTTFNPEQGNPFNQLFSTATTLYDEVDDGSGFPTLKLPRKEPFQVRGIFSDLRRHDLGPAFWEENFDGSLQREFVTEPLWGVGSTAPYGHDGRSPRLRDVILRHGGEAQSTRDAFAALNGYERSLIYDFLEGLVLFSPPATASNLDPADLSTPQYPVFGHGSIKLSTLFEDPQDAE